MADPDVTSSSSWSRNSIVNIDPNEKLFLFGYSCKIFRDDDKSTYIDQGKHLIPWMGDETIMIDRYDARGYLHDLQQFEPEENTLVSYEDALEEEEERICDEERYRSLNSNMTEEQLYQEEELKRLRAAVASDGAYHEIGFSYDTVENDPKLSETTKEEEPEDELYDKPEGLELPKDMEVPHNMKIHAIIEKTASFVSEQGGQMEIIIKMKQQANPQFAFMHFDNPLNPYYKHLVKEIKLGTYKPVQKKKVSQSEDEDEDGHYLHPSLLSGKSNAAPKFTVPNINFRRSSDDSYSILVRNLKQHQEKDKTPEGDDENSEADVCMDVAESSAVFPVLHPPPDLQPVIDKMAEYVVKNGEDFEFIVKGKQDTRFDFLNPWNEYYNYYINKRNTIKMMSLGNAPLETEPVVRESGPILYQQTIDQPSQVVDQSATPLIGPIWEPPQEEMKEPMIGPIWEPTVEAEDVVNVPQPRQHRLVEVSDDDTTSDSMEFEDSMNHDLSPAEEGKDKKALVGPICFSLKQRDTDTPTDKTLPSLLLLGGTDSEPDDGEKPDNEESSAVIRRKSIEEPVPVERESKSRPNNDVLEAKQAEERIKDKLAATVRERLAHQRKEKLMEQERLQREEQDKKDRQQQVEQQRKDKLLQLERKKKAELFLAMLRQKNSDAVVSHVLANQQPSQPMWDAPTKNYPPLTINKSSDSESQHSGEAEPISVFGEKGTSSDEESKVVPSSKPKKAKKQKKKKHRSKSQEKKRSRHRSRSLSRERKVRKELPAAYAFNNSTRSRSRSPRRYRQPFNHWRRR